MKITLTSLSGFMAILISAGSLVVSIGAYRVSSDAHQTNRTDKDVERRLQEHASQIDKKSRLTRVLREFRSLGYLYFFAETASQDRSVPELEARHVEHHRLVAELTSLLDVIGDSFGPCVKAVGAEMRDYLGRFPWEQQIQNPDFHDKIRNDRSGKEGVGDMISRAIFIEEFDHLVTLLERRMDKEMISTTTTAVRSSLNFEWWEPPCEEVPVMVEIEASSHELTVNDVVTLTPKLTNGEDFAYTYNWAADEALAFNDRVFECRFTQPGIKLVNLTVTVMKLPKENQGKVQVLKKIFARDRIKVITDNPTP